MDVCVWLSGCESINVCLSVYESVCVCVCGCVSVGVSFGNDCVCFCVIVDGWVVWLIVSRLQVF